jgi:nucleotide-binding universal stress UspA family protein
MRLVVVHIADGVPPSPTARREARRRSEWLTARILAEQGVPNVDRRVAIGTPSHEIAEIAGQEQPEMIIIGSKRQGRRPQPPLRSRLASELAELTPYPVLIVPPAVPTAALPSIPLMRWSNQALNCRSAHDSSVAAGEQSRQANR